MAESGALRDPRISQEILQLVVEMVTKDNILDPAEGRFLARLKARLGLSVHDGPGAAPIGDTAEAARRFGRLPEELRAATLDFLIEAALVDGRVVESERELLVAVAATMGVERDRIDAAITRRLASRTP